jgi:sensor histidine kinase regulating citrate/malate metabolism
MIQHQTNDSLVTNAAVAGAMSIEMNSSMFQLLTSKVYTDPILAVMREWSTNAIDACLASSKPVNFDVHLPTMGDPVFSVRDYSSGLSESDMLGLFCTVGASTKRNSNEFNGTFG